MYMYVYVGLNMGVIKQGRLVSRSMRDSIDVHVVIMYMCKLISDTLCDILQILGHAVYESVCAALLPLYIDNVYFDVDQTHVHNIEYMYMYCS